MQKTIQKEFRIEKVINRRGDKFHVKRNRYNNSFNSWIDLKNVTGVDISSFTKKTDLANLKSTVDKLDIDELKNVPTNLSNLKVK